MGKNGQDYLNLFGERIAAGECRTIYLEIAKLHTTTKLSIPIIVERSVNPGPVVLITAGIHGDEINGIEIVRQVVHKKINKPAKGTIICIPIVNVFGFVNRSRAFPDGRDLNRVFPGSKNGSLAGRFAHQIVAEVLPKVHYCFDFHTGGAQRFNAPQVRLDFQNEKLMKLADIFQASFTVNSKNIPKTFRSTCDKFGIDMLLFEGGKTDDINDSICKEGVEGIKRVLHHLEMLSPKIKPSKPNANTIYIENSTWVRAKHSGLLHNQTEAGKQVRKGDILATITDPYGKINHLVKSTHDGFIINANHSPIVYQGDAIYHLATDFLKK
ncbi:MAG: succinylglutamate desuccinylase/aspartoacylase family protein [Flavobacteriaceae bacterium]|nr:succinylglutamate desuccinylase/aspartoacylase family protein [Flavobacteriaceae bacterium]MDZ4148372.1 succinylglutamate desuccinylase/aspartoacylase family protein [Flavobacteriaceae bacterium]